MNRRPQSVRVLWFCIGDATWIWFRQITVYRWDLLYHCDIFLPHNLCLQLLCFFSIMWSLRYVRRVLLCEVRKCSYSVRVYPVIGHDRAKYTTISAWREWQNVLYALQIVGHFLIYIIYATVPRILLVINCSIWQQLLCLRRAIPSIVLIFPHQRMFDEVR